MISRAYLLSILVTLAILVIFMSAYIEIYHTNIIPYNEYISVTSALLFVVLLYCIPPVRKMIEA